MSNIAYEGLTELPLRPMRKVASNGSASTTSEIIYESNRRKRLNMAHVNIALCMISIILAVCMTLIISFANYDQVTAVLNQRYQYLNATTSLCDSLSYGVIDLVPTPISIFLTIIYSVVYKRRSFLKDKFKYNNFGLPMIVSVWNKTQRFYTSFVYGLIALQIFTMILSTLYGNEIELSVKYLNDPTGLLIFLIRIAQVVLIGLSKSDISIIRDSVIR